MNIIKANISLQSIDIRKLTPLLVLIGALSLGGIIHGGMFFSPDNLNNLMTQAGNYGLLAIGMTIVILTAGIDLSVGCTVAASGVLASYLVEWMNPFNVTPWLGVIVMVIVPVALCAAMGLFNGVMVGYGTLPPFIATLATMFGYRGLLLLSTEAGLGKKIVAFASDTSQAGLNNPRNIQFNWLGSGRVFNWEIADTGRMTGILPISLIALIIVWIIIVMVLNNKKFGRYIYAVGGNEEAARMMGVNTRRIKMWAYTICGGMAGLSGIFFASSTLTGMSNMGMGFELKAVAAVVLGGAILAGGQGSVSSSVIGMIAIRTIINIISLTGSVPFYVENFIIGMMVVLVVILQTRGSRKQVIM